MKLNVGKNYSTPEIYVLVLNKQDVLMASNAEYSNGDLTQGDIIW